MTADDKKERLETAIAAIRATYGQVAIRRLRPTPPPVSCISTGFPDLDKALAVGGLPQGHIIELISQSSSGASTLTLHILAQAQAAGTAVYLDIEQSFDPAYAAQLGVDAGRLLLIEPASWREACAILRDFVLDGQSSIFIFDAPMHLLYRPTYARLLLATLDRLTIPMSKTAGILLFLLTLPPDTPHLPADQLLPETLIPQAAVRLVVYRMRWLYRRRDISGYEAKVYIARNRLAPTAPTTPITLTVRLADANKNSP
jgi:recombination protein RecA